MIVETNATGQCASGSAIKIDSEYMAINTILAGTASTTSAIQAGTSTNSAFVIGSILVVLWRALRNTFEEGLIQIR